MKGLYFFDKIKSDKNYWGKIIISYTFYGEWNYGMFIIMKMTLKNQSRLSTLQVNFTRIKVFSEKKNKDYSVKWLEIKWLSGDPSSEFLEPIWFT